jgi:hypothetical protein
MALVVKRVLWDRESREIKKLDKKVKVCFLTAGEMYNGVSSDIFSSQPANCLFENQLKTKTIKSVGDT